VGGLPCNRAGAWQRSRDCHRATPCASLRTCLLMTPGGEGPPAQFDQQQPGGPPCFSRMPQIPSPNRGNSQREEAAGSSFSTLAGTTRCAHTGPGRARRVGPTSGPTIAPSTETERCITFGVSRDGPFKPLRHQARANVRVNSNRGPGLPAGPRRVENLCRSPQLRSGGGTGAMSGDTADITPLEAWLPDSSAGSSRSRR
jgi:hypothetical protein